VPIRDFYSWVPIRVFRLRGADEGFVFVVHGSKPVIRSFQYGPIIWTTNHSTREAVVGGIWV
jgi:hypothetical protein